MRARPVVVLALASLATVGSAKPPPAHLPPGLELIVAAAPPLVTHPIMASLDDRGRLFVGDAAGVNLNRQGLEEQLPNRILLLTDTDGDGVYDHRTVFADKMTFPQGSAWLDGSLYVASPPGIWKLTDTDGDGVADRREMIVGGFDFDGNAADVHGPFLHPTDGRLYWCHGRKGHKVVQRDGTLVHEGKASGIWSCRPDGLDVQWHSLGCMDNPVEVDFAPDGSLFGVVNLYYNQPRGDTLVHWLYGGVYERPDQLAVIAGLPRTRETMPVVHNYGHVAVSGSTFYRSGALNPAWRGDMLVTFFNTQKVVRTHLTPAGATFTATEHELLKIDDPDVHLTDVLEDRDGSLLVLDTGGWFRLGCPSSLTAKPDLRGAIYRVRSQKPSPAVARPTPAAPAPVALAAAADAPARLRACEALARAKTLTSADRTALLTLLAAPLDPALEHAAMFAALATRTFAIASLPADASPTLLRRLLVILDQTTAAPAERAPLLALAERHAASPDADLARTAVNLLVRHPGSLARLAPTLVAQLDAPRVAAGTLNVLRALTAAQLATPAAKDLLARMLAHSAAEVRTAAWRVIAGQTGKISAPAWLPPLEKSFAALRAAELPLLLEVVAKLGPQKFAPTLQTLVADAQRPAPIRLKALAALAGPGESLPADAFALLVGWTQGDQSPSAKLDAARLLARARLTPEQLATLAPLVAQVGPMELSEFLKLVRRLDAAQGQIWAEHLARSSVFSSIEESALKTAFSALPATIYERTLAPAVRAAAELNDAKKRRLETLSAAAPRGHAAAGRAVFESSACVACHKVGDLGRALGPDLSHIGKIRGPRDLLESILFPSATLARDYETHAVETSDGQTHTGMIKANTPDALILLDVAGQEKSLPHTQVIAHTQLPTSLMPAGLEQTFSEQQLLDLIAWLVSLQ
jgi:putative membrane-bound dehydrogenase-like protein